MSAQEDHIHNSPYPLCNIPEEPLHEWLSSIIDKRIHSDPSFGKKIAIVDGISGHSITFEDFRSRSDKLAYGLHKRGLSKGDTVAVLSPNIPEYTVVMHGVLKTGAILTSMNPVYTAEELLKQFVDSEASVLFTLPMFYEKVAHILKDTKIKWVILYSPTKPAIENITWYNDLIQESGSVPKVLIDPKRDVAVLPYSSGTTGLPKGVMLSHYACVAQISQLNVTLPFDDNDVVLGVLPFFHLYGMMVILNYSLHQGVTIVSLPKYTLEDALKAIEKYRITDLWLVPPILLQLSKDPSVEKYDLSSVKSIASGAAPLGEDLAKQCHNRLKCKVRQGYGMTECNPTFLYSKNMDGVHISSVGRVLGNTQAKIVDVETGKSLPIGERGEICVRGPQMMLGYWKNQQATDQTIDKDGWLHTGDVGYIDNEGNCFVVDRAKELIKVKGFQVAPAELESVLLSHPHIADAAVIGVTDEVSGEVPKAYVVTKGKITESEVMDFVKKSVAPFKQIRHVQFTETIPKSPSGKILRRFLAEQHKQQQSKIKL